MRNGDYVFARCSGEHEAGRGGRETRSESALCSPEKTRQNNGYKYIK